MCNSKFIKLLEAHGFIKRGDYTLKSGMKSSFYIDLRNIGVNNEVTDSFISLMGPLLPRGEDVALLGVPDGATSLAAYLRAVYKIKHLILPKEVKKYGHTLDASHYQQHKIILIEDVASTGSSLVEVIKRLEQFQASIIKVVPIIDRELGAREMIAKEFPNLNYEPVISMQEIEKHCDLV